MKILPLNHDDSYVSRGFFVTLIGTSVFQHIMNGVLTL